MVKSKLSVILYSNYICGNCLREIGLWTTDRKAKVFCRKCKTEMPRIIPVKLVKKK